MCNEQNQDKIVYHSAKVNGVDLFEDEQVVFKIKNKDGTYDLVDKNGYSLGETYLKLI